MHIGSTKPEQQRPALAAGYKPPMRIQIGVMVSFFLVILPAIALAALGYMWYIENVLKLDVNAKPEGIVDRLFILVTVLPMIPVMVLGILVSGILWMLIMARLLSWPDIQYYTAKKGPRCPILSDWLDRLWLRMTEFKRPQSQIPQN